MSHTDAIPIPPGTRDEILARITPNELNSWGALQTDHDKYLISQSIVTTMGWDKACKTTYYAPQLLSGGYNSSDTNRTKYGHFHYDGKLDNLVSFCPNTNRPYNEVQALMERMKKR